MADHLLVFVDDEPNILHSLNRVFLDDDYQIECFTSTSEAYDYISSNPVSLVISDQRMPGESGSEFLIRVKQIRPETIRMILTGYSDLEAAMQAINEGEIYKILMKPWSDEDLRITVQRSLEFYDLKIANQDLLTELLFKNSELDILNKKLAEKINERTKILLKKTWKSNVHLLNLKTGCRGFLHFSASSMKPFGANLSIQECSIIKLA